VAGGKLALQFPEFGFGHACSTGRTSCRTGTAKALWRYRASRFLAHRGANRPRSRGDAVASGDSVTRGRLVPVIPRATRLRRPRPDPSIVAALLLEAMAEAAEDFDVIHFHIDWIHLPLMHRLSTPFLTLPWSARLVRAIGANPQIPRSPSHLDLGLPTGSFA
jgi:hypothetical protein